MTTKKTSAAKKQTVAKTTKSRQTRQTRTLTLDKVPLDVMEIIKNNRRLEERWQDTVIRLIEEHDSLIRRIKRGIGV